MNARTDDMQRMDEQTKARLARRQAQAHACITIEGYKKAATARATLSFWRSGGAHNGHASGERLIDDGKRLGIFDTALPSLQGAAGGRTRQARGELRCDRVQRRPGVVATSIWTCAGSTGSEGWPLNRHCGIASDLNMTEEAYQKRCKGWPSGSRRQRLSLERRRSHGSRRRRCRTRWHERMEGTLLTVDHLAAFGR